MIMNYKVTSWRKAFIPDDITADYVIERLHNCNPTDLVAEYDWYDREIEHTEEYVTVDENDGCDTIQILKDDGGLYWDNSFETEIGSK